MLFFSFLKYINTMCYINLFIILMLLMIINQQSKQTENMSNKEIKRKSIDLFKNKDMFKPGVKYSSVKKKVSWIDPVVHDEVYKEALNNNLSISNLEKIFKY
jgi:hypothetical protein